MQRFYLLFLLAAGCVLLVAAPPRPIEFKDVTYLEAGGQTEKLDVYQNVSPSPAPVLVYFHGGAWWKGERPKTAGSFSSFLAMGFSVVSVDYRLAGVAAAPAGVQDARCAVAWVAKNAAQYHFDVNRIVIYGTSAGGHLALMAGMLPTPSDIDLPQCKAVPRAAAILDFYGIADVNTWLNQEHKSKEANQWLGPGVGPTPVRLELGTKMSPLTYVRVGLPPVLLIHGDADPVVPHGQAERLQAALAKAGVPNRLYTVPGGHHGEFDATQKAGVMKAVEEFLVEQKILDKRH